MEQRTIKKHNKKKHRKAKEVSLKLDLKSEKHSVHLHNGSPVDDKEKLSEDIGNNLCSLKPNYNESSDHSSDKEPRMESFDENSNSSSMKHDTKAECIPNETVLSDSNSAVSMNFSQAELMTVVAKQEQQTERIDTVESYQSSSEPLDIQHSNKTEESPLAALPVAPQHVSEHASIKSEETPMFPLSVAPQHASEHASAENAGVMVSETTYLMSSHHMLEDNFFNIPLPDEVEVKVEIKSEEKPLLDGSTSVDQSPKQYKQMQSISAELPLPASAIEMDMDICESESLKISQQSHCESVVERRRYASSALHMKNIDKSRKTDVMSFYDSAETSSEEVRAQYYMKYGPDSYRPNLHVASVTNTQDIGNNSDSMVTCHETVRENRDESSALKGELEEKEASKSSDKVIKKIRLKQRSKKERVFSDPSHYIKLKNVPPGFSGTRLSVEEHSKHERFSSKKLSKRNRDSDRQEKIKVAMSYTGKKLKIDVNKQEERVHCSVDEAESPPPPPPPPLSVSHTVLHESIPASHMMKAVDPSGMPIPYHPNYGQNERNPYYLTQTMIAMPPPMPNNLICSGPYQNVRRDIGQTQVQEIGSSTTSEVYPATHWDKSAANVSGDNKRVKSKQGMPGKYETEYDFVGEVMPMHIQPSWMPEPVAPPSSVQLIMPPQGYHPTHYQGAQGNKVKVSYPPQPQQELTSSAVTTTTSIGESNSGIEQNADDGEFYDEIDSEEHNILKEAMTCVPEESDEEMEEEDDDDDTDSSPPPPPPPLPVASRAVELPLPPPKQGILIQGTRETVPGQEVVKKSVTFADGIKPGKGVFSGDSPPPPPPPPASRDRERRRMKHKHRLPRAESPPPPPPPPGSPPPPPPPLPKKTRVAVEHPEHYPQVHAPGHLHSQQPVAVAPSPAPPQHLPGYGVMYSYPAYPSQPMYAPVAYGSPVNPAYSHVYQQHPVYMGRPVPVRFPPAVQRPPL